MIRKMQGLLWLFLLEFSLLVTSLEPGFLDFDNLPDTNFSCVGKVIGGYYADLETNCQMFHVCTIGQLDEPMDIRFLCLNGTVFDQETRVCERIDEVDCSKSEQFYSLNLELYGNTQPPIVEESQEVDYPLDSKKSSSTATPTTVTPSTFAPFFTTPTTSTTSRDISKVITSHHFPVNVPDIRFNPEEINISLKAGGPPDISRSQIPISYQQQSFSEKNTRVSVTTHTTIYKNDKPNRVPLLSTTNQPLQSLLEKTETTLTPKSIVSYGLTHNQAATPTEINYGFAYPQTEDSGEYHTDIPPHPYQYQLNIDNFRPPTAEANSYHSTYRASNKRPHKINFPATTYRNHPAFTSTKNSPYQARHQTQKPPHLQLPIPLLPTLPPLTFSSPSPFSIDRHIETKRYTKDHLSPPRIIISASASVSDNSGRRLNYSLGTIGASHILGSSPASYDDYKEEDVISDPFYHDVPKLKKIRRRRSLDEDMIKTDEEAEDILRYLFNWYKKREDKQRHISIPVSPDEISQINEQLAPVVTNEESQSERGYERIFRKILMEGKKEKQAKTDDCTTDSNDFLTTFPTVKIDVGTTPKTLKQPKQGKRKESVVQNETIENKQVHFNVPVDATNQDQNDKKQNIEEFRETENVERNLNTTDETTTTSAQSEADVSEYDSLYDDFVTEDEQNTTETTTAEALTTKTIQEYDYGNSDSFYDDISYDSSSLPETTTTTFTETTPVFEISQSESQSTRKEWNGIANTKKPFKTAEASENHKETSIFTIPDYVDDNYEPLTYQLDTPNPKEYDSTEPQKKLETTTIPPVFELLAENVTNSDNENDATTATFSTDKAETTLVTEEMQTEVTTPSTTITTVETSVSETELITDATTSSSVPTQKLLIMEELPRHRFRSFKERNRDKQQLKLKVLNTTNENDSSIKQEIHNANTNITLAELSPKLQSTTLSTDRKLETGELKTESSLTDAPLLKSANPTKSKYSKVILSTTPLTKVIRVDVRKDDGRYIFNCFNKRIHQFYSDPRDCRLFHYCTLGYTKNQLVDMKFVCDLGTYYDEERFICTKVKPDRCL